MSIIYNIFYTFFQYVEKIDTWTNPQILVFWLNWGDVLLLPLFSLCRNFNIFYWQVLKNISNRRHPDLWRKNKFLYITFGFLKNISTFYRLFSCFLLCLTFIFSLYKNLKGVSKRNPSKNWENCCNPKKEIFMFQLLDQVPNGDTIVYIDNVYIVRADWLKAYGGIWPYPPEFDMLLSAKEKDWPWQSNVPNVKLRTPQTLNFARNVRLHFLSLREYLLLKLLKPQ